MDYTKTTSFPAYDAALDNSDEYKALLKLFSKIIFLVLYTSQAF